MRFPVPIFANCTVPFIVLRCLLKKKVAQVRQNRTAGQLLPYGFEVRTQHQLGSVLLDETHHSSLIKGLFDGSNTAIRKLKPRIVAVAAAVRLHHHQAVVHQLRHGRVHASAHILLLRLLRRGHSLQLCQIEVANLVKQALPPRVLRRHSRCLSVCLHTQRSLVLVVEVIHDVRAEPLRNTAVPSDCSRTADRARPDAHRARVQRRDGTDSVLPCRSRL